MKATLLIQLGAISGFLSVVLGAFGAHGLKGKLTAEMLVVYHTAVEYQFYHTLALLLVGLLWQQWGKSTALMVSASGFLLGIVIFSGSLYVLSLTGIRWLGAITPVGGLAFIIAWISLFFAAYKAA